MIELQVQDYCHGCCEFDPEVMTAQYFGSMEPAHYVVCRNSSMCINIYRHLEKKFREEMLEKEKGNEHD